MSYPQSVKDQFLTLRTEGHSYARIAPVLKVSRHTLILWGKAYKVQIDADRAVDQEELVNTLQLRRIQRLTLPAELYHRICRTIEKADLMAKGVGPLVTILLKLNTAIETYDIDPAACDLTVQKTVSVHSFHNLFEKKTIAPGEKEWYIVRDGRQGCHYRSVDAKD